MVEYLRLQAPNAWGLGLIPDQETRSHMPELKILHVIRKTQHSQIKLILKKNFFKEQRISKPQVCSI